MEAEKFAAGMTFPSRSFTPILYPWVCGQPPTFFLFHKRWDQLTSDSSFFRDIFLLPSAPLGQRA